MTEISQLPRIGLAGFIFMSMNYMKNTKPMRENLAKKNLNFNMVLEATDYPYAALLKFHDHQLEIVAIDEPNLSDKSKWDVKIISTAPLFFDFFMDRLGTIRPILTGKLKLKKMLNILKVFWFVRLSLKFFNKHQSTSEAMFRKLYPPKRLKLHEF